MLAVAGCSDDGTISADETDGGSATSPTTGPETSGSSASASASDSASASGPAGDSSSSEGSGGGADVAASLEECIEAGVIPIDCSAADFGIQWVAYAPEVGCTGAMGGVDEVAQFLFRLDEVVEEEAQIRGLRLQPPNPSGTDQIIAFTAGNPVPYSMLPLLLEWPSVLQQMAFAGGLSFIDVTPDSSTCELEAIPAWEELGMGATLRGTFELGGGTLTVLDEDGNPTPLVSQGFELRGCFQLPAESYVLELDE